MFLIFKRGRAFLRRITGNTKKTFVNPFDAVAEEQRELRLEADGYRFFIKAGFVTKEELINIYKWIDEDSETKDKDGKLRIMILKKLPDSVVQEVVDLDKQHFQPSRLRYEIQKRMRTG